MNESQIIQTSHPPVITKPKNRIQKFPILKGKTISRIVPVFVLIPCFYLLGIYTEKNDIIPLTTSETTYSIGIYKGENPFDLKPDPLIKNPVMSADMVTDVPASFVADPFIIKVDRKWFLFFEILNKKNYQGDIGLAISEDLITWKYQKVVLDEPFHLSYPYVFKHENRFYMIPESHEAYSIRLYRAEQFPYSWKFTKELVRGDFSDPSIVNYQNNWWIFTSDRNDMLHVFYSSDLDGPYKPHSKNPVIFANLEIARPGGRVIVYNNNLIRYAQGCKKMYGYDVKAFIIENLSPRDFIEKPYVNNPILRGSGKGWNSIRMHHCDPHQIDEKNWIASVDGVSKKIKLSIR